MVDKKSHRWGRIVLGLILKVGFEEGSEPFGVLEVNTAAGWATKSRGKRWTRGTVLVGTRRLGGRGF